MTRKYWSLFFCLYFVAPLLGDRTQVTVDDQDPDEVMFIDYEDIPEDLNNGYFRWWVYEYRCYYLSGQGHSIGRFGAGEDTDITGYHYTSSSALYNLWLYSGPDGVIYFQQHDFYNPGVIQNEFVIDPGAPDDPCGPMNETTTISNGSQQTKTYGVVEAADPEIIHQTFTLGPLKSQTVTLSFDEICNPVFIAVLNEDGVPLVVEEVFQPDAPDPPPDPDPLDPPAPSVPVDLGTQQDLPFEDTDLKDVVDDPSLSDVEKRTKTDYLLWQRTGDKLDSIENAIVDNGTPQDGNDYADVLNQIEENTRNTDEGIQTLEDYTTTLEELRDNAPTTGDMNAAGQTAANDLVAAIPQISSYDSTFTDGAAPIFLFAIADHEFDVNPFQFDVISDIAAWIKAMVGFFLVIQFAIWASTEGSQYVKSLPAANQAKGNAVMGGTGAQEATALIAAGLIGAVMVAAVVAVFAWSTYDFGLGTIFSLLSDSPFNTTSPVASATVYFLDKFIPLGAFVAFLFGKIIWRLAADTAFLTAATLIRFIVP